MSSHSEILFWSFLKVSKPCAEYDAFLRMLVYDQESLDSLFG